MGGFLHNHANSQNTLHLFLGEQVILNAAQRHVFMGSLSEGLICQLLPVYHVYYLWGMLKKHALGGQLHRFSPGSMRTEARRPKPDCQIAGVRCTWSWSLWTATSMST